jgi:hypothetical protein
MPTTRYIEIKEELLADITQSNTSPWYKSEYAHSKTQKKIIFAQCRLQ